MNKVLLGHIFAVTVVIFWGMTFVSGKVLLNSFTPVEMLFNRFVMATSVLICIHPYALKFHSLKAEFYSALVGFFGVTLYFVLENNALLYSSASNVCLIVATAPLFVALFNRYTNASMKLGNHFFKGFAIAMLGIACLSYGSFSLNINPIGDVLALGCAAVWGLYVLYVCKLGEMGLSSLTITVKSFFYALLLTVPLLFIDGYELKFDSIIDPLNLSNYIFLAVFASSAGFYLWNKAIVYIGSVKTNLYIYATPVVTALGAVLCIDEKITAYTLCGMILALGGLFLSQRGTKG